MQTPLKLIIEIDPDTASIQPIDGKRPGSRHRSPEGEREKIWKGLLEYAGKSGPMPVRKFLEMAEEKAPKNLKNGGLEDIRLYLQEGSAVLFGAKYSHPPRGAGD
jgi:hypothetical protein